MAAWLLSLTDDPRLCKMRRQLTAIRAHVEYHGAIDVGCMPTGSIDRAMLLNMLLSYRYQLIIKLIGKR